MKKIILFSTYDTHCCFSAPPASIKKNRSRNYLFKKNDESGQIIEKLELKDQIDAYIDSSNLDLSKGDNSNDVKKGMEAFIYLKQHTQTKLTKRFIEENAIPLKDYITEYDRLFHNNPLKQKNLDNLEKRFKAIYGVSYQEYKKIE